MSFFFLPAPLPSSSAPQCPGEGGVALPDKTVDLAGTLIFPAASDFVTGTRLPFAIEECLKKGGRLFVPRTEQEIRTFGVLMSK